MRSCLCRIRWGRKCTIQRGTLRRCASVWGRSEEGERFGEGSRGIFGRLDYVLLLEVGGRTVGMRMGVGRGIVARDWRGEEEEASIEMSRGRMLGEVG